MSITHDILRTRLRYVRLLAGELDGVQDLLDALDEPSERDRLIKDTALDIRRAVQRNFDDDADDDFLAVAQSRLARLWPWPKKGVRRLLNDPQFADTARGRRLTRGAATKALKRELDQLHGRKSLDRCTLDGRFYKIPNTPRAQQFIAQVDGPLEGPNTTVRSVQKDVYALFALVHLHGGALETGQALWSWQAREELVDHVRREPQDVIERLLAIDFYQPYAGRLESLFHLVDDVDEHSGAAARTTIQLNVKLYRSSGWFGHDWLKLAPRRQAQRPFRLLSWLVSRWTKQAAHDRGALKSGELPEERWSVLRKGIHRAGAVVCDLPSLCKAAQIRSPSRRRIASARGTLEAVLKILTAETGLRWRRSAKRPGKYLITPPPRWLDVAWWGLTDVVAASAGIPVTGTRLRSWREARMKGRYQDPFGRGPVANGIGVHINTLDKIEKQDRVLQERHRLLLAEYDRANNTTVD